MKYYTPHQKQMTLDLERSSLDNLDKSNRWVQMSDLLPWATSKRNTTHVLTTRRKVLATSQPVWWSVR